MNNAVRDVLRMLIRDHGSGLADDPRRCEGLLRDLCPHDRREVNLLVHALKEGVPADLLRAATGTAAVERATAKLEQNLGASPDAARWAAESWALAVGVATAATLRPRVGAAVPPAAVIPTTPPTGGTAARTAETKPPPAGGAAGSPATPAKPGQRGVVNPPARVRAQALLGIGVVVVIWGLLAVMGLVVDPSGQMSVTKLLAGLALLGFLAFIPLLVGLVSGRWEK